MNNRLSSIKEKIEEAILCNGIAEYELGFEQDHVTGGYLGSLIMENFAGIFSDSGLNKVKYYIFTYQEDEWVDVSLEEFINAALCSAGKFNSKNVLTGSIYQLLDIFKDNVETSNISILRRSGDRINVTMDSGEEFELTIQEKDIIL